MSQPSTTRVFPNLGFPEGAAAPQTIRIPGAAPPGSVAPWRAAPSKLLAPWGLRTQNSAHGGCAPEPLQWLRSLMTIFHPSVFIGNYQ